MLIKFPTPWKTLIITFPPPRDGPGAGPCWRFDLNDTYSALWSAGACYEHGHKYCAGLYFYHPQSQDTTMEPSYFAAGTASNICWCSLIKGSPHWTIASAFGAAGFAYHLSSSLTSPMRSVIFAVKQKKDQIFANKIQIWASKNISLTI